jgi:hypothetical protein
MSRDQRPRRVKMIDTGPIDVPATRRAGDQLDADVAAQPAAPATLPKPRVLPWVMLFLLACVAGATGTSLMSWAGML